MRLTQSPRGLSTNQATGQANRESLTTAVTEAVRERLDRVIRINDQWRVIFKWVDGDAYEVRVVDYH